MLMKLLIRLWWWSPHLSSSSSAMPKGMVWRFDGGGRSPAGFLGQEALMRSVDCWPLAIIFPRHSGASPYRYPASAVTGGRYPPLERCMSQVREELPSPNRISVAECRLGNLVGAIGWRPGYRLQPFAPVSSLGVEVWPCADLLPSNYTPCPLQRGHTGFPALVAGSPAQDSYLVDSASSHMLVSKIKPCMSKYKQSIR